MGLDLNIRQIAARKRDETKEEEDDSVTDFARRVQTGMYRLPKETAAVRCEKNDRDALLEIAVSEYGMEVRVVSHKPASGRGMDLTLPMVSQILLNNGVFVQPDIDACRQLFDRTQNNQDVAGMIIARGTPPQDASNARLEALGDLHFPVFPGDAFAGKAPPTQGRAGLTVDGKPAPPRIKRANVHDVPIITEGNCLYDEQDLCVESENYGLAEINDNKARVRPLMKVGDDDMVVTATIYPRDFQGNEITLKDIRKALLPLRVNVPLDIEAVNKALTVAHKTGSPVRDVVLAVGRPPKDGEDGRMEMAFDLGTSIGKLRHDGRLDFNERGRIHWVKKDEYVGRIIPPTRGMPGQDVFGKTLPAQDGLPAFMLAGENVHMKEEGGEFYSEIEGMLLLTRNMISVTEVHVIKGDVNNTTGNIHADTGSVVVHRSICDGYSVEAKGNLIVGKTIEDATVVTGGDIAVRQGIHMHENTSRRIECGGALTSHFAQNARFHVKGNAVIDNDITNCEIVVNGRIIASQGDGRIQGGKVRGMRGVEAKELGSELGVTTVVCAGHPDGHRAEVQAELDDLEMTIKTIESSLNMEPSDEGADQLLTIAQSDRQTFSNLMKARLAVRRHLEKLRDELLAMHHDDTGHVGATIEVLEKVHPGTVIEISGCRHHVKLPMGPTRFAYDHALKKIFREPLMTESDQTVEAANRR